MACALPSMEGSRMGHFEDLKQSYWIGFWEGFIVGGAVICVAFILTGVA